MIKGEIVIMYTYQQEGWITGNLIKMACFHAFLFFFSPSFFLPFFFFFFGDSLTRHKKTSNNQLCLIRLSYWFLSSFSAAVSFQTHVHFLKLSYIYNIEMLFLLNYILLKCCIYNIGFACFGMGHPQCAHFSKSEPGKLLFFFNFTCQVVS